MYGKHPFSDIMSTRNGLHIHAHKDDRSYAVHKTSTSKDNPVKPSPSFVRTFVKTDLALPKRNRSGKTILWSK